MISPRGADALRMEVPELIPARMLNEFAYCPRLCYLEWVQGEWADNLETQQGSFGHRRVDQPTRKKVPGGGTSQESTVEDSGGIAPAVESPCPSALDPQASTIHARSLMLSALDEGLIAKLDLLELDGNVATPVDYKRGSLPSVPEGAYEPERVQLCAQGLILRENGYQCDEGVLYFIESKRRVVIPLDDQLVARTRELVAGLRAMAGNATIPPPLDDSPKCPRCSLVGICLPDEVNWLRELPVADRPTPEQPDGLRRLIPVRDVALPLYVQEQGMSVSKTGEQVIVKKKGETVRKVKLKDVSQVCLFGGVHVTAPALREFVTRGIPVCHLSYGGWFFGMTTGLTHKNVELRIAQFATASNPVASLDLARSFVTGKLKNSRTMLRRHLSDDAPDRKRTLDQLNDLVGKAERAESAASLLGIEGMGAKAYFAGFAKLLKGDPVFDFEGRNRRPPKDPVNALLSFVYAMLSKELTVAVQSVGFDPMLGFYHTPRYGRASLALDLAEEFRPLIADSTVLTLINNGEVSASSFVSQAGAVALTSAGRKAVLVSYERRLNTEITHPIFGYKISYRRILEVQARLLARTVMGELPEYPSFCTR